MASVFRQQGSPYWYAAFFDGTGKRRNRSTKQTKKSDAIRVGAEMERLTRRASKTQTNDGAQEIYRILEDAGARALRGTLNESKAREMLSQILFVSTGQELDTPTIEEWLNGWLEEKKNSSAEGTFQRYEGVIRSFLAFLPASKRKSPLTGLSIADMRAYRNWLQEGGRSATTVNLGIKIIRTPLNLARRLGYITTNPSEAIEAIVAPVEEKGTFTPRQVAALTSVCSNDWKGMIVGGYYTGARIGDLSNLKWDAINLERRTIDFLQGKTKQHVEVPIHPELENWLHAIPENEREGFVFPSFEGKTSAGRNGLSGQFRLIMKKAKIKGKTIKKAGSKGRNRSTLSFHSLRHSFNSAMANAGVPQEMRQRLTGHASKAVNDRYTHTELQTLRNAVAKVPGIFSTQRTNNT